MSRAVEEAVRIIAREVGGLVAVYRHGTYGTPDARPDSDLDLAILAAAPLAAARRLALAAAIGEAIGREADLADLRTASTVFQARTVAAGECVFTGDERARREFEMRALAAYAMLNEERAGIIADAQGRGSIHG